MRDDQPPTRAPLRFLPPPIRGVISFVILSANTVFASLSIVPAAIVKFTIPITSVRRVADRFLHGVIERWIAGNDLWISLVGDPEWRIEGLEGLRSDGWYLVVSNHQSWADIFVLQKVLNRRIPPLKFTLKRQLIWVPFAGLAWWALDFPFMSRHSEEFLRKYPERRGEDLVAIRKACEKFKRVPTTLANFLEGTRFTPEKHAAQGSKYRHLLRPRAGGVALALDSMGEQFQAILDVTIFYPNGAPTFFEFLSGKTRRVVVLIDELPVPAELTGGDYANDESFRSTVRNWVNELWIEKDRTLARLLETYSGGDPGDAAPVSRSSAPS